MKKWILTVLSAVLAVTMLAACSSDNKEHAQTEKLHVAVSFNAMKEFTEAVGKDNVEIITIIPDGTEPHDFQPTTKNMKDLSKAKVFICHGLGLEPWAEQAVQAAANKDLVFAEAAKGVNSIKSISTKKTASHAAVDDPHAFLSLSEAQTEVQNIADALAAADPKNASFYQQNAVEYKKQLQLLKDEYAPKFASLPQKHFVTGHAAFAYLCRDFGLTQNSVEDVFADGEPSTQKLAELVTYCKDNHVKTIFTEDLVSPKTSETLAKEVGATTKQIHTMESSEGSLTYLDRMKENLDEIYTSLRT